MPLRPTCYSPELADRILGELRAGRTVYEICRDSGMPCRDTVFEWVRADRDGFAARYRQAREAGHGRPGYLAYSPEIVEAVLAALMTGRTLSEVCGEPGMPGMSAVQTWLATDRDGFAGRYRAARTVGQRWKAKTGYCAEIAEAVLGELMRGIPLRDVCADPDMPSTAAVTNWLKQDRDGFRARYLEARQIGCFLISDDMLKIVDDRDNDWITRQRADGSIETVLDPDRVARAALRIKTRNLLLAKFWPQVFGDRHATAARRDAGGVSAEELAEMMDLINGGGRPGDDEPSDED